jgi:hypothetical protein
MAQLELFTHVEPPVSTTPTAESVRARIDAVLETLSKATVLPWTAKEAARWKLVLPQMADWLPPEERDTARREFAKLLGQFERPLAAE